MKKLFKRVMAENGQAIVIFAVVIVAILGICALVLDLGMVKIAESNMQNAADATALAAVQDLPNSDDATNSALVYGQLNGVEASNIFVTTPYNGDTNQIEVICTKTVKFMFATVLGFEDTEVSERAVAKKISGSLGAFENAIFSGSSTSTLGLGLYGARITVDGDIHTNNSFMMTGSQSIVNGSIEAVYNLEMYGSDITVSGTCQGENISISGSNISIGSQVLTPGPFIDMPDFSDTIQESAQNAGQTYTGYTSFQGSNVTINDSIYVQGDVNVSGSTFTGNGVMLATGNITISGANITASGGSICFYSENGNIQISGANTELHGLLYAPNGTISINGANTEIYGRIIANKILITGANTNIISSSDDLDSLGMGGSIQLVE